MISNLFIVYRQHQMLCCNRYITENKISDYRIVYFYKNFDISLKEKSGNDKIFFYPFISLKLSNFFSLCYGLYKFKSENVFIGDPYFYRLYSLAFVLLKNSGRLYLLDDGNTSITLIISMKRFFTRLNFNKFLFYSLKRVKIKYDGYFLKDLQKIKNQKRKDIEEFNKIIIFGTSISSIGYMKKDIFLNMLRIVFLKFSENTEIIYYPHPNEQTDILNEFSNIKIDKHRTLLKSLNLNTKKILFLTFSSSISVELALKYPKCTHKFIPISKFINKPKWLKREFLEIEKMYYANSIKPLS